MNCEEVLKEIALKVSNPAPQGQCYTDGRGTDFDLLSDPNDPEVVAGFSVSDTVYCQRKWVVRRVDQDALKGGHWILTRDTDYSNEDERFLVLDTAPSDPPADVYIAYDSRATRVPRWLRAPGYQRVDGSITITRPGQGKPGVELSLWRTQTPVSIPGNLYGNPGFSSLPPGEDPVMYTVIVKPEVLTDCKPDSPIDREFLPSDPCGEHEAKVKAEARLDCERNKRPGSSCGEPICQPVTACVDPNVVKKETGLSVGPWIAVRHSEIAFENSSARVSINNQTITSNPEISGILDFEYRPDGFGALRELQINRMTLSLEPFDTDVGRVEDTVLALLAPVKAQCADPHPPWATPCSTYEIPQREMIVSEFARIGDKKLLTVTQNAATQFINVDHANRGFQIQVRKWRRDSDRNRGGSFWTVP
jgi:hypothetical protein